MNRTASQKKDENINRDIYIEPLNLNDFDEAADLLSKAFIRTPFSAKVAGGTTEKHRRMLKIGFKGMLAKKPGLKFVARQNGNIVGVMRMVKWPECQNSIPQGIERIPTVLFGRGAALRLFKFRSIWHKHDPKKPHWHIDPIGVLPDMQGKGIGSILLSFFCEYIDKEHEAAYHETDMEQNVRLYKKFGYEIVETESIFGITNWFLWRSPKEKN
jgi:ribosomal protein S18 acetylase RimI-like enzyme